jgi:hypothetical protein
MSSKIVPLPMGRDDSMVTSIVAYDSMCKWIAQSENLADCKDIADKSAALKEYARRIKNTEAERRASNVRLIAERRYGELLKQLARTDTSKGGDVRSATHRGKPIERSPYARALADTGVSIQAASRYQALARVPKTVFDEAILDPQAKPTIRSLIQKVRDPQPKMPDDSLWIWGRMRDFERDGYSIKSVTVLLDAMTETMRADVARIAPLMQEFFNQLAEATNERI